MNKTTEDILRWQAITALGKDIQARAKSPLDLCNRDTKAEIIIDLYAIQQLLSFSSVDEGLERSRIRKQAEVAELLAALSAPPVEVWEQKRATAGLG